MVTRRDLLTRFVQGLCALPFLAGFRPKGEDATLTTTRRYFPRKGESDGGYSCELAETTECNVELKRIYIDEDRQFDNMQDAMNAARPGEIIMLRGNPTFEPIRKGPKKGRTVFFPK